MVQRISFALITLFWIVMNVLLWHAEFGGGNDPGGKIDAGLVWQKILTAPDDSGMEMRWRGQRIGYCRWTPAVTGELDSTDAAGETFGPDGMVEQLRGYTIDFEGNVLLDQPATRVRFSLHLQLAPNRSWRELSLHVASRPRSWKLHTVAARETLTLDYEDEGSGARFTRAFTFDELRNPRRLIEEMVGPLAMMLPDSMAGLDSRPAELSPGLEWDARTDWLHLGHARVRVYRLRARLLDRYELAVIVNRVGEIMRVDLPDGLRLVNEGLASW